MKKISLLIIFIFLLFFVSCSSEVEAPDNSWEDVFKQYWNVMNTEYVHFSEDMSYDWDRIYEKYLPLFKTLDYTKSEDSIKAFKYFKEIAVGVHDNHYNLTVKDGLGNTLKTSPALLNKYASAGGDIMDFPDVKVSGFMGEETVTINNPADSVDIATMRKIYKTAIPSIFEIDNLIQGKDITDEEDSTSSSGDETYGYFHSTDGNIATEFPDGAYYGYTFKTYTEKEIAQFTQGKDSFYATEWNFVVEKIGISSYFYGVNKDNIFYFYFSEFGNLLYLTDLFTKEELTPQEEEVIDNNTELKFMRQFTRGLFDDYEGKGEEAVPIEDESLKKRIGEGLEAILGLQKMYKALLSVTATNEFKYEAKDGTDATKKVDGIIVDLRGNGGGAVAFLSTIWGSFFSSERQFGYVRYKSGYSRYEYTPWVSFSLGSDYINEDLSSDYAKPVAVLVNGYSVSCSELSCVIAKLLPKAVIIGHTTFGGTCALTDRTIYNSGPFTSENLSIYTTTYQFKDINGNNYETIGITPDIPTGLNPTKDEAYIEAVKWVKDN